MHVGEVRIAEDKDFERLKSLVDAHDGWKREYFKSAVTVWTKSVENTDFKMIKVLAVYSDVTPSVLYDVLHDPEYRKFWDHYVLESYDIGHLNPNNDIGYYAVRCPSPLKNRDFVLQRSWLETGKEHLIINHSVFHEKVPLKKGFVRAVSFLTGFVIRPSGKGSTVGYVTHSDPKGSLPTWLVNKLTEIFAPKMVKRLHKACLGYEAWKCRHNPNWKPWMYPEQIAAPKIQLSQCLKDNVTKSTESLDECGIEEKDFREKDFLDEDRDEVDM